MKTITAILLTIFCTSLSAQSPFTEYLNKNNVSARIDRVNDKFWNPDGPGFGAYEVPKGSGAHAQFANGLWIGGLDSNNTLRLCVNTWPSSGDYFAGPLDTSNITVFTNSVSNRYGRLWKLDCDDISNFVSAFNSGAVANNTYQVPEAILSYPAIQNGNYLRPMQHFFDANNDGLYDPVNDGDYPIIKGHQQVLSIYNDQRFPHFESKTPPMGLEIHEKCYSYHEPDIADSMQIINFTTFVEYTIYNRSNNNYHDVYVTDWQDVDLGDYTNDYIGTDTANQFVYTYNSHQAGNSAPFNTGYGNRQPVISHALLECPSCSTDGIDNNHNNMIDEPGENFLLDKSMYFNSHISFPAGTLYPGTAYQYYNYMQGMWKDSTVLKYGFTGYNTISPATSSWVYTGDPQYNTGWTESTAMNPAGDRRILMSSGPFDLPSKRSFVYSYAIVFSRDTTNNVNTITRFNTRVKNDIRNVRHYAQTHQLPECMPEVTKPAGLSGKQEYLQVMIYPNPAKGKVIIAMDRNPQGAQITVMDITGRPVTITPITEGHQAELDINGLKTGIYLIEIVLEGRKVHRKLVKN